LRTQHALLVAQHLLLRGAAPLVRENDAFLRAPGGSVVEHHPLLGKGEPEPAELDTFLAAQSRSCVCINGFSARRTKI